MVVKRSGSKSQIFHHILEDTIVDPTPAQAWRAGRIVVANSRTAEEAEELLDMLGLMPILKGITW